MDEAKEVPIEEHKKDDKHTREISTLKSMNQLLEEKNKQLDDKILRSQAELQNFKRRRDEELTSLLRYCNEDLIKSLLPVLDNLERAINNEKESSSLIDGLRMIYASFVNALKEYGVTEIEALDKQFNPSVHQAVMTDSIEDKDDEIVLDVLQKGYMLLDKVIRPAMVKVNKKERKEEINNE